MAITCCYWFGNRFWSPLCEFYLNFVCVFVVVLFFMRIFTPFFFSLWQNFLIDVATVFVATNICPHCKNHLSCMEKIKQMYFCKSMQIDVICTVSRWLGQLFLGTIDSFRLHNEVGFLFSASSSLHKWSYNYHPSNNLYQQGCSNNCIESTCTVLIFILCLGVTFSPRSCSLCFQGPFDGILGFSQGAAMVSLLCGVQEQQSGARRL